MLVTENAVYELKERFDQIAQQLTAHLQKQNLAEAGHQQLHKEVQELRDAASDLERWRANPRSSADGLQIRICCRKSIR